MDIDRKPEVVRESQLDFQLNPVILNAGDIQMHHDIYPWTPCSSTVRGFTTSDNKYRLAMHGRLAVIVNKTSKFLHTGVLTPEFIRHMSRYTEIAVDDEMVTLSRVFPILGKITVEGTWERGFTQDDRKWNWMELPQCAGVTPSKWNGNGLYSVGPGYLKSDHSFTARLATVHYELEPGVSLLVLEFIVIRRPTILGRIPSLIKPLCNWALNRHLPKVIRRVRKYDR